MEETAVTYHFDEIIDRRNTNSLKWDVEEKELPMWVADMDFQTAPEIREAIEKRAAHGVFGYSIIPEEWQQAYVDWWKLRHHFTMEKDWLIFCTGVIPAISSTVRKLTTPAEKVVVMTPVYNIFFNSIYNNGRNVLENKLIYEEDGYHIDFEDLEEKLSDPQTSLLIFCNPQNPGGKIWDRETIARVGELCDKYHVLVISDEIHCDLTDPGKEYVPYASVSEICRNQCIMCIAPTKTFNIAGMQTAAVAVPNPVIRHKVWRALNTDEVAEPNAFAVDVAVAAFTKGGNWLDELRSYIKENKTTVIEYVKEQIPQLKVVPSDATYLLWLDCRDLGSSASQAAERIREATGLYLSAGEQFGKGGEDFLRMNIACPRARVVEGLERLKKGVEILCSAGQK